MFAPLWAMPVAKARPLNGWRTLWNSDGWLAGAAAGIPCWAWVNSGLVDGCGLGCGGAPRSVDVPATVGRLPRLACESSLGTDSARRGLLVVAGVVGRQAPGTDRYGRPGRCRCPRSRSSG